MTECPWCKKYIEIYLKDDKIFSEKEFEEEKERVNKGFWASIKEVKDEQLLANRTIDTETALKMGIPMQIDLSGGEVSYERFWFFSLAKARDEVSNEDLQHYWIQSGACSISCKTPICCELANFSSNKEQIEWEIQSFEDLRKLTQKVANRLKEGY